MTVKEVNAAPVLAGIADATVAEGDTLRVHCSATDSDVPANTLTYSLPQAPEGAAINGATGDLTWAPSEVQRPGTYLFRARVGDDGAPPLSDERAFTVTVVERSVPPWELVTTVQGSGTVARNPDRRFFDQGTEVVLTATPASNYWFSGWSGAISGTANPIAVVMDTNKFIEAHFVLGGGMSFVDLHPAGASFSQLLGVTSTQQVGNVKFGDNLMAGSWSGTAGSFVLLHPTAATVSYGNAIRSGQQAGWAQFGANAHAGIWFGTADSWIDLNPPGAAFSWAEGTSGSQQAGWAYFATQVHAGTWSGTASSWVDMHPAGADASYATTTCGNQQGGVTIFAGVPHGGIWSGTAGSWVDLHPTGSTASFVRATTGAQQAGVAYFRNAPGSESTPHAAIWSGTASSWADLNPAGATTSYLEGTTGRTQAGWAEFGGVRHAGIWSGTPDSFLDLQAVLGPDYSASQVSGVWREGTNTYVGGQADLVGGGTHAILWVLKNTSNSPPVLEAIADALISEGQALHIQCNATDADVPANNLIFSLEGAPEGATIGPATGLFSWTPTEAQAPGVYAITVKVTDDGALPLSDNRVFTVTALERSTPPWELVTTVHGSGTVTRNPDLRLFDEGTEVVLTATPVSNYWFSGWSGTVSGPDNPVTVVMNTNKGITAHFALRGPTIGFVDLHPVGATFSQALGTMGNQQVGNAAFGGSTAAGLWSGTADSFIVLHPAGATASYGKAIWSGQQAGWAQFGANAHAGIWSGTAASWLDLNPPGATFSWAEGISGSQQAGWAYFATQAHAGTWSGTAGSWVDMHPVGADASYATTTCGSRQGGVTILAGVPHAGIWSGTAGSWVDLHPTDSTASFVRATTGTQQAGVAYFRTEPGNDSNPHAAIWSGTASSWVDLNPPEATASYLEATTGRTQAGWAEFGGVRHAGIWSGTATSFLELQAVLGPDYSASQAAAIWNEGATTYVAGQANFIGGETHAILWILDNTVNSPPVLEAIVDAAVSEGETLRIQCSAGDADVPANTLTFGILLAPEGVRVNPGTGELIWIPREDQGPGVYPITVKVTDDGTPPRSDQKSFTVTVNEVNTAPSLTAVPDQSVDEGVLLVITNIAADVDLPTNQLTFSLGVAPAGMAIDPTSGVLTWTPRENQGPATYTVVVRVFDNGDPPKSNTKSFQVTVREVNQPPKWLTSLPDVTVKEGTTFTASLAAVDDDIPANKLHYSLLSPPSDADINPETGVFTWTPGEAQGPGEYQIRVMVTDDGVPPLSATNGFRIVVAEVNQAPKLALVPDQRLDLGQTLVVTNVATDLDIPANQLTFGLVDPPVGAAIDSVSGILTWKPSLAQLGTNTVTIRVTDDGSPSLSDTNTFKVVVVKELRLTCEVQGDEFVIHFPTVQGWTYRVEYQTDLAEDDWMPLVTRVQGNGTTRSVTDSVSQSQQQMFYRVVGQPGGP